MTLRWKAGFWSPVRSEETDVERKPSWLMQEASRKPSKVRSWVKFYQVMDAAVLSQLWEFVTKTDGAGLHGNESRARRWLSCRRRVDASQSYRILNLRAMRFSAWQIWVSFLDLIPFFFS